MIAALILAAGESRRMGRDKALLSFGGKTFLRTIIDNLRYAGIESITVVLGHNSGIIQRAVDLSGVRVVVNREYERGQTSSLQAGLAAAVTEQPEGVIICLVDHPAVSAEVILRLKEQFQATRPIALIPTHKGEHGHPVVISPKLFSELLSQAPGEPANITIRRYRDVTEFLEVDDRGVLLDVDEPRTYEHLEEIQKRE